jgi:creatinine amidohydrolase
MEKARLMEHMTVKEVKEGLEKTKTVVVPVGCTEQHGWHLPLSTDIHNAYETAKLLSALTGVFVAPAMPYSFSGGTLPGTINITPQTTSAVVNDICSSLVCQGFKNIIVLLGHGGSENTGAIKEGLEILLRMDPKFQDINVALVCIFDVSPTVVEWFKKKDFHAGAYETSLMLYWHPEQVRENWMTDSDKVMDMLRRDQDAYQSIEKKVDHPLVIPHASQDYRIKIGVLGYPCEASKELGEKIVDEILEYLVDLVESLEGKKA